MALRRPLADTQRRIAWARVWHTCPYSALIALDRSLSMPPRYRSQPVFGLSFGGVVSRNSLSPAQQPSRVSKPGCRAGGGRAGL